MRQEPNDLLKGGYKRNNIFFFALNVNWEFLKNQHFSNTIYLGSIVYIPSLQIKYQSIKSITGVIMDAMVIKYVGLAGVVYGTHAYLAVAQVALCLFLMASGAILLSDRKPPGKWASRLGLMTNERLGKKPLYGWLMLATGAALILPLFGLPHWFAVIACPVSFYWIKALASGIDNTDRKKTGSLARKGLMISAVLIFGFTIWEGRDLVRAGGEITYKAAYWQMKEVQGWQKENNPNVPKVGEMAPDFELTDVTGTRTTRLSDFRGKKPVVLLFGSFT